MSLFFLIIFGYSPRDIQGSSHAPTASSSIGVLSDVFNMDAATPGGSATAESDIIYDKFILTPIKNRSGSLGGYSCYPCYTWIGGVGPGVVLIRLNALTFPERNESKYSSEITTGNPFKSPADSSTCSRVESPCDIQLKNTKL